MRHAAFGLLTVVAAAILLLATRGAWNRLHNTLPNGPAITIPDGSPPLGRGTKAFRLDFPEFEGADGILLRFRFTARRLRPGQADWQTGRMLWEWVRDGHMVGETVLAGVQGDQSSAEKEVILPAGPAGSSGRLRIENLGTSGTCRLIHFEAVPTKRPMPALAGLLGAAAGWLLWAAIVAGSLRQPATWIAAIIWVGCAFQIVLPGPWLALRPLCGTYDLHTETVANPIAFSADRFKEVPSRSVDIETPNLLLRWKLRLRPLRPLLHVLLFFVPSLVLLCLAASEVRVIVLMAALALLAELAQWGFGYGFQPSDILDLVTDALGIAMAVTAVRLGKRIRPPPRGAQG